MKFLLFLLLFSFPAFSQTAQKLPPTTADNLARAEWRLGFLNPDRAEQLDNYLRVTECDIYKKYYNDEFEWAKIRAATADYLKNFKEQFSNELEFVQPLYLDRYDLQLNAFKIMPGFQVINSSKLQISGNNPESYICTNSTKFDEKNLPPNATLSLVRPFNLLTVPSDNETAQAFLKSLGDNGASDNDGRLAYIRYRVRLDKVLGVDSVDDHQFINFSGALTSVDIFGDKDLKASLGSVKFK